MLTPRTLQRRWTGKSFFAASTRRNLIDFPPWRKSRGPLQDFALLPQDLILAPQPLQLSPHILMPFGRRRFQITLPALVDPSPQPRKPNAEIGGYLLLRSPARLDEPDRFSLEIPSKPTMQLAHEMLLFPSEELSTFRRQGQTPACKRPARQGDESTSVGSGDCIGDLYRRRSSPLRSSCCRRRRAHRRL